MTLYTKADLVSSRRIYEGIVFSVRIDTLTKADNESFSVEREVVEHNGGVVIAAMPDENKVILIKQHRYAVDEDLLELPAGRVELGEDRFVAARRELLEETGYEAGSWEHLPEMYSAPGFCTELLSFYLAKNLVLQGKQLDHDEETEVLVVSLEEARNLIVSGKIRDAKTAAGLSVILLRQ